MNKFVLNCLLFCALTISTHATTYTVTNTNDAGAGSLRDAITQSNAAGTNNIINFNIAGIAPHTITLASALPVITRNNTTIDGTTQPANGYTGVSPKIVLNGPGAGNGLNIGSSGNGAGSAVYGLYIKNFSVGIYITVNNVVIGAANKGNVISGNTSHGINVNANSGDGTVIKGNYIGLDITGTIVSANGGDGMRIEGNSVDNSIIGGSASGERNIISGNTGNGIYINANSSSGNIIKGNYIGTDVTGTLDRGNGQNGINSGGNGTGGTLGGNLSGEGNVISGNNQNGMYASASNDATWTLKGNYIGTNAAGTAAIPNTLSGLDMVSGSNSMTFNIGGTAAGDGNLISGNGTSGLRFREANSDNYTVYGNKIGTDVNGTANIGNTTYGIYIDDVSDVQVGGTTNANQKNIIAFNGREGVYVHGSNSIIDGIENDIHRNSFFCNSQTSGIGGILLDNGGNYMIPAPVIVTANSTGCSGTSPASALIEIFYDDSCTFCEGKIYIGSVTATAGGAWSYTGALSSGRLVATANISTKGTSQFSSCFPVCALAASASSSTPVSCFGAATGSATVTPTTGTPNYTYLWSPGGQTTSTATGLISGNYTATVTDAGGCTTTATVSITQPSSALSTTLTASSNVSCNGGNNGSASVFAGGGTPNYTYLWTGGQTTATATGLANGNYTVTVRDANGCSATRTVSISQPSFPLSVVAATSTNVNCNGGGDGTATVTPGGGTPNYTYLWTPTGQTTPLATGLSNGSYTVVITDANGCTATTSVTIAQPSAALTSTVSGSTNVNCNGGSDGTATVTPGGGTPNYTYFWNPTGQTTPTATGLSNGAYVVTITDANGCTTTNTVSISQPSTALTSTVSGSTNVNCNGGGDGTAVVTPGGGTPNYTYLWSPSGQTSPTATGLGNGTYTVLITDANGCTSTSTVSITQPLAALSNTISSTLAGCSVANGTATANPAGGTPNYTYLWSNGQTTQTATALAGGSYTVTVTDNNGCTHVATVNVGSTTAPTATASATQATCGSPNGTGTVNPAGGAPAYTYNWSNGQTAPTATGLAPGTYTVLVTDNNGCTATASVTVSAANGPTVSVAATTTVLCNGGSNGSSTATISGGTAPFTFQWSNGQTTATATGLTAGSYTVVVLDSNNCSFTTSIFIAEPTLLGASVQSSNVSCNGGNNGSATVTAGGGTPVYTYLWSNGQSTPTATGLAAGTYTVVTVDANGCTVTNTVTISEPTLLTASVSSTAILCNGGTSSATVTPGGGTPNYTYLWSNGQTTPAGTGLSAGSYTVVTTDLKGCTVTNTITISEPTLLTASVSATNILCNGGTATATANPAGGTPAYTYVWNNGQTSQTATGLVAGSYTVTIRDQNGCSRISTITITQPTQLNSYATSVNATCNGGNSGSVTVTPAGGTPVYTYLWNGGQTTPTVTGLGAGTYTVIIRDANGCTSTASATVTQPPVLVATITGNSSFCLGEGTVLGAAAIGGTPAYTYLWSPGGETTQSITVIPTASASYTVAITDANGCNSAIQVFNITIYPSITALFDSASTGGIFSVHYSFTDLGTGGTSWVWYFGDGTTSTAQNPIHTFPGAGTYTVTQIAYSVNGCPDTFQLVVTIPEGIIIPNVFTPNSDGPNDVWYIPNSGMEEFHVVIFDRWGAKVWEAAADEIRWDGRSSSGKMLSDGTYYYVLQAILRSGINGKNYSTTGWVTLLTNTHK